MQAKDPDITHTRIVELINYDPDSGVFSNRVSRGRAKVGMPCGGKSDVNGYRRYIVDRNYIYAGRLAWFFMTGSWPKGEIDHINRNRGDNRFINLRDITHAENANNRGTWGAVKLKGVRVSREGNRYVAQIMHRGKCLHLGSFKEAAHAHSAFLIAESALR